MLEQLCMPSVDYEAVETHPGCLEGRLLAQLQHHGPVPLGNNKNDSAKAAGSALCQEWLAMERCLSVTPFSRCPGVVELLNSCSAADCHHCVNAFQPAVTGPASSRKH